MVRRGGKPYRKASQKGRNGGKTRREILSDKLRQKRRRLRENNQVEMKCHAKPATLTHAEETAVFGIYKDEDASYDERWVLTALAVTDEKETMNHHRGGGYSSIEVQGRYALTSHHGDIDPRQGLEIARFEQKSGAMSKINADGSNRVEHGYLIRPEHNPRTLHTQKFDKDAFHAFSRGNRVYE